MHRDWYELLNSDVLCLFLSACAGIHFERKRVESREIKVRLTGAGIHFERKRVESREINLGTSGLKENLGFRCMLDFDTSGLV